MTVRYFSNEAPAPGHAEWLIELVQPEGQRRGFANSEAEARESAHFLLKGHERGLARVSELLPRKEPSLEPRVYQERFLVAVTPSSRGTLTIHTPGQGWSVVK